MSNERVNEWVDIPGYPGYAVTATGEIRGPRKILKQMSTDLGHRFVSAGYGKSLWVHHAVLFAFVGPRPEGQECRHLDGNPANNSLDNLRWGTRLENMRDKATHGTEPRGEERVNAKLTTSQVAQIRLDERPHRVIAREYGVAHSIVGGIQRGQRWIR
jgi:hypothetical protein